MDEQRAWIKSRRKKRLRMLAAALALCLLVTTYPDILATLSVLAAGTQGGDDTRYVTGFADLPEEVREQTVPLGTEIEELTLPDSLEAFVTVTEEEEVPENKEDASDKKEKPDGSGSEEDNTVSGAGTDTETGDADGSTETDAGNGGEGTGADTETGTEGTGGDTGTDENGDGSDSSDSTDNTENNGDSTESGGDTGNSGDSTGNSGDNTGNNGDNTGNDGDSTGNNGDGSAENGGDNGGNANTGSSGAGTDENNGGDGDSGDNTENSAANTGESGETPAADTGNTNDNNDTNNTDAQQEQSAPKEANGESAPQAKAEPAAFSQETYTVTLPVYAAENELDIETLEQTEQVTIENITWESDPSYDAETEGVYVFTPVLPEGYALSEGAVLPEIRVEVEAEMTGQTLTPEQYAHMIEGLQDDPALLTEEDVLAEAPELAPMTYGLSRAAGNPGTYSTTEDNEDNAGSGRSDGDLDQYLFATNGKHPIEANIFIQEGMLPRNSCYIAVRTYDVNWRGLRGSNEAEYDKLFVNGVRVGTLTGLDYDWNTSYYRVPLSCLKEGKNTVRVEIWDCMDKSQFGDDNPNLKFNDIWGVAIDWMQLICDGGSREGVEEFSLTLKPAESTVTSKKTQIGVETVIKSTNTSAKYDTEYSIMDSKGFIVGSLQEQDVQDGTRNITVTMPADSASGTYTVQGLLKNAEGAILATDSAQFRYIKGSRPVFGPQVSHTLSPETLTNRDVTVTPKVVDGAGCTDIVFSPASQTATANGEYSFTVTYNYPSGESGSSTYTAEVANIDKEAPDITYNSAAVISAETMDAAKEQLEKAWTITDNLSPREKCTVTYSLDCSKAADFKKLQQAAGGTISVTVTATDEAGNKSSDTRTITVAPLPLELGMPTAVRSGTTSTFTLTAEVLTAVSAVTESGFVWGTMQNPTLTLNQGSGKNALNVKTNGEIQVSAKDIVDGATYYCRAYAKAGGVTYYSEQASFGINAKSYGTFTVTNNNSSTFTITRTGGTDGAQTVYYRTVNGSAVGGTHFEHKAGTVVFGQGETKKTVTVTEKGVTAAYDSKPATSYSNADRTYQVEIYRVDGGGTLGDTTKATRKMAIKDNYTVNRNVYTTETSGGKVTPSSSKYWVCDHWHGSGGDIWFYSNRGGRNANPPTYNYNFSYKPAYNDYLENTITGWLFRYDMTTHEKDDGWEHLWVGSNAPKIKTSDNYDNNIAPDGKAIPLNTMFGTAKFTGSFEMYEGSDLTVNVPQAGSGVKGACDGRLYHTNGTMKAVNGNNYIPFGKDDTAYCYFDANGNGWDTWYIKNHTSYSLPDDTEEPSLLGIAPMVGTAYKPGDAVVVSLIFDEIVDRENSRLGNVSINTSWGKFTYAGGADTNVLYFEGRVPDNATGTLEVNSINGTQYIKDMCDNNGTVSDGSGSVTVSVDTTTPTVSITNTSLTNGTAQGTVKGTNVNTLKYAWTQSETMPVTGWITCTSGTVAKTRQDSGKWYLHVLGTYNGTGANDWKYKEFDFGTPEKPASPPPSLKLSANNENWAQTRPVTITKVPANAALKVKTPSGKTETLSTSQTSYTAKENGMYTFTMTVDGEAVQESILISKLDHTAPTVVLKDAGEAKDGNGSYILYHTLRMTATAADSESGVKDVKYCFTTGKSAPAANNSAWETATVTKDGVYVFEKAGESTTAQEYYLHVMAADKVGNAAEVQTSQPYMLVKGQDVKITLTEDQSWTNGETTALTWKITDAGAGSCTVSRGETILATGKGTDDTGDFTVTENGVYSVSVRDKNGNTASVFCAANHIDREAPEFNVSAPSGYADEKTVTLSDINDDLTDQYNEMSSTGLGGSQVVKREYQAPGETTWTAFTGTTFPAAKNGIYTVRLTDAAGNVSEKTLTLSGIDATDPTAGCEILSDKDTSNSGWYTANPFQVKLTYADGAGTEGGSPSGIASVEYKWVTGSKTKPTTGLSSLNAAAVAAGTCTLSLGYYDNAQAYYLYYKVTDKTGNITDGFSGEIKKDSYMGAARVTGPAEGVSAETGLEMKLQSLSYGPSGGKVTGGQTAEAMSVTLPEHDSGQKTYSGSLGYTATATGNHYFRIYPGARNSAGTASSYYWAFYVRKVTFDCQGGPAVDSQLVWHDSTSSVKCKVKVPTVPVRTGYTFGGWYTDAACTEGKEFDFNTQLRADTTLYAKWTANTYKVTYEYTYPDGNGGNISTSVSEHYTYGKGHTLLKMQSLGFAKPWMDKGFAFDGWYADANFADEGYNGPSYTAIGETATGDKKYYGRCVDVEAPKISKIGLYHCGGTFGWHRALGNTYDYAIKLTLEDNTPLDGISVFMQWNGGEFEELGKAGGSEESKCIKYVRANRAYASEGDFVREKWPLGENTIVFKAVDKAGNETYSEPFSFKWDNDHTKGKKLTFTEGEDVTGIVKDGDITYLCGKDKVVLHTSVEDAVSGIRCLKWDQKNKGEEENKAETKYQYFDGVKEAETELVFEKDCQVEFNYMYCWDMAGNGGSYYSIDYGEGSKLLTKARWVGIIVENTAPEISITELDANGTNERPLSDGWYESPPSRIMVKMDDTGDDGSKISSGIKSYTVYVNGKKIVGDNGNLNDKISSSWSHNFFFPSDAKGVVTITVEVEDHAGNTARKSVDVKIKGQEQTPAATPDYPNDALKGLAPGEEYKISYTASGVNKEYTVTADASGRIPFVLDGKGEESENTDADICGRTVSIVKLGAEENGKKCSDDSEALSISIAGRPAAIDVNNIKVTPEVMPETGNAVINLHITGDTSAKAKEYRWQSVDGSQKDPWKDVPDTNTVQNLKAGNVFVRVKATDDAPHGLRSGAKEISSASNKIKAVFNLNDSGGVNASGQPQEQSADKGSDTLAKPADPTREGYAFTGWYMESDCRTKWRFEGEDGQAAHMVRDWRKSAASASFDPETVDGQLTITLYAGWRENVPPTLTPALKTTAAGGTAADADQEKWYPNLSLSLDYSDNVEVTKLSVSVDGGAYHEVTLNGTENGTDAKGNTKYTIDNVTAIREGNHTYAFKAQDAAGNVADVSVIAKQDGTPPALGAAAFTEGHRSFWDWIVGKTTLTVTIPVTETLSGIYTDASGTGASGVQYTLTPDGGSAGTPQKAKVTGSTGEGYTAAISIDPDFKGKIEITATDNAGNKSATQTIGADGSGINGVIVEDNAPEITILADRKPADFSSTKTEIQAEQDEIKNNTNIDLSDGAAYYNSAPRLYVKAEDTGTDENGKITSGLQSVTWKIEGQDGSSYDGGVWHDAGLNFDENILTQHSFTISALEELSGVVTVTVKATDQAGNTTTMQAAVKIKAREAKPEPQIDYENEKLRNLVTGGTYKLLDADGSEKEITADEDGCIEIKEEWFGREIQLSKTGNGTTTLDSVKTDVKPAARPAPPKVAVTQNETKKGKADGIIGKADDAGDLDLTTLEYSTDGGESWTAVTDAADVTAGFTLSADQAALENCAAGACLFRVRAVNDAPNAAPHGEQMEVIVGAGRTLILSFEENGGSEIEDITGLSYHDSVKKPKDPKREGYALAGWYTDEACSDEKEWHFEDESAGGDTGRTPDRIEENTTLYAGWEDTAAPALTAVLMDTDSNDTADEKTWYNSLSAALTYSDNEGVTFLSVGVDLDKEAEKNDSNYTTISLSGAVQAGTGADGSIQYRIDYNDLQKGEHTYTFRAADAAGNVTLTRLSARLDKTAPVMGKASYGTAPANLWDWIIGKDSLIITVPVTEEGSGVEAADYVLTPDGDSAGISAGTADIKKISDTGAGADYAAVITVPADFKGKVKVTAKDKAGNASAEKTLGVDKDEDGRNGVIVEDNAPDIQFSIEGGEVEERYYETAPVVDIAVDDTGWTDGTGTGGTGGTGTGRNSAAALTTGGIGSVVCTITNGSSKNEYRPDTDYEAAMKASDSFAIPADKLFAGINTITVTAKDHAGNTAVKTVTVKVKTPEGTPNATIGYVAETLNGLKPGAEYRIEGLGMRADEKGSVPIDESWIGKTITVVQMGSTERTTESAPQSLILPARPEAPNVTAENETYPGAGDGKLIMTETGKVYQYSADGLTWKDAQTGADMKITGLAAKDYYVRAKAIENKSFRSKEGTVTVGTTPPTPYDTPTTAINYENEKLSNLVPGAAYIIEYGGRPADPDTGEGGKDFVLLILTADEDGNIPVQEEWMGEELSIIRQGNGREKSESPEQLLTIPVRPGKPNPSGEDETGIQTGAKLKDLTANTAYDISRDNGKSWLRKTADGSGVISGVNAPAEYIVRVAAVNGFKSENSDPVKVDGFHIPVTYMVNGSAYDTSWAYYGKAPQNIPAVPKKADAGDKTYVGEWCADVSGTPADLTNITAETTVYAYYTIGYNVILKGGTGYSLTAAPGSASPVKEGGSFTLQFTLSNGYEKTDSFAVKVNGVTVTLKEDGTYTIENITEDQTVTVEGIRKKPSSGGSDNPGHDSDDQTGGENNPPAGDNPSDGTTTPDGTTPADGNPPTGGTKPGTETLGGTETDEKKLGKTDADEKKPGETDADEEKPGETEADEKKPGETDADQTKPGGTFPHKEVPEGKTPGGNDFPDGVKLPDGTKFTAVIIPVTIEDGRIVIMPGTQDGDGDGTGTDSTDGTGDGSGTDSAAAIPTGSVPGMEADGVILQMADGAGAVVVTVICEDEAYTAGVKDTIAVANAVLTPEQIQLVDGGETIEILIDVKDITDSVPLKDKEIIEDGIEESRKDHPGLTLGMYIDISMFVKIGGGDWNTITHTEEPVDVVIGIPETLKAEGREFTIIRSHDGEYTLLPDIDDNPDTITISTNLFSAYAIAYEQTEGSGKCGLCHICPTFLGICYFIWLAVILAVFLIIWILVRRRKKEEEKKRKQ